MNALIIFIIVLACILVGDLLTSFLMTWLFNSDSLQQNASLDQTYLFYFVVAMLITIVFTLLQRRKKNV